MKIENLRYKLIERDFKKGFEFQIGRPLYEIMKLCEYRYSYRLDVKHIKEDINEEYIPEIPATNKDIAESFNPYEVPYKESYFKISELLCFIYGSINSDFNIARGKLKSTFKKHFWLENEDIVYSPGLQIITKKDRFYTEFVPKKIILNGDIDDYLISKNNLAKFYSSNDSNFSVDFITRIKEEFNRRVNATYEINDDLKSKARKEYFKLMRSALTRQRQYLVNNTPIILSHPDVPKKLVDDILIKAKELTKGMGKSFSFGFDSFRNCFGLSIVFNLYDESFKLVQGYYNFPYKNEIYRHSWLEKDGIVYDPAMRIITLSNLYYQFFTPKDVYSKEEIIDILHRIGNHMTFFSDYFAGEYDDDPLERDKDFNDTAKAYD